MVILSKIYACAVVITDSDDNDGTVIMCRTIDKGKEVLKRCYEKELENIKDNLDCGLLVNAVCEIEEDNCFAVIYGTYQSGDEYSTKYRLVSLLMDEQEFDYTYNDKED